METSIRLVNKHQVDALHREECGRRKGGREEGRKGGREGGRKGGRRKGGGGREGGGGRAYPDDEGVWMVGFLACLQR